MSAVSQYYEISVDKMKSKSRSKEILTARNVAMYLLNDMLDFTLKKIGEYFGGRNHSTIINCIDNVTNDSNLMVDVEKIKKSLPV